jgi:glycosyltransferase involved in cell wall biosynthesis
MKIAFVMNDLSLSGGTYVVLEHAQRLASNGRHQVSLVLRDPTPHQWAAQFLSKLELVDWNSEQTVQFDIGIATYWETLGHLGFVAANNYIWFCQSLEDRFVPDRNPDRTSMQLAASIPVPVLTEAQWIADFLGFANPQRVLRVVRNGIDKKVFYPGDSLPAPFGKMRVLVEGPLNSITKNTEYALSAALRAESTEQLTHIGSDPYPTADPRYTFVLSNLSFEEMALQYRSHHVLLKTSLVEGMFGPPLEAFHCGTPAIVTPVTGSEEYIRNGLNALVVPWNDERKVAREIDRLAGEEGLWEFLSEGALKTASAWPDWDKQAAEFEIAIVELSEGSKLSQTDMGNLSNAIAFNGSLHWLAMRRLSDKSGGLNLVEEAWLEQDRSLKKRAVHLLASIFRSWRQTG